MAHSPPINRKARTTLLFPRPLHGHIGATHQPLAYVVQAMGNMIVWKVNEVPFALVLDALLGDVENLVQICPDILEAVQLVEYRDVVLLTAGGLDAGPEMKPFGLVDDYEAIPRLKCVRLVMLMLLRVFLVNVRA